MWRDEQRRLNSLSWSAALEVHLIDGTYELFRHYYGFRQPAMPMAGKSLASVACSRRFSA
jgi:hypothetical protein